MNQRNAVLLAAALLHYAIAIALMHAATPHGVQREALRIEGSAEHPSIGSLWLPMEAPKAVLLLGHGVSENQGTMATIAKAFAAQGYAAAAFDFYGHGRSQVGFDWQANAAQVRAWCAWAHARFPGLPLAYLGHSMGGFAGTEAFQVDPQVQAFVSLGAFPRAFPPVKTLIAAGRFEELFTPEDAQRRAAGHADVLISPWSNHALEPWDPVLIGNVVPWVDAALGVPPRGGYPWRAWAFAMLATLLGTLGVVLATGQLTLPLGGAPGSSSVVITTRRWSLNPYRIAARILGSDPGEAAPRAAKLPRALLLGTAFAALIVLGLSFLLRDDIFTAYLEHPRRLFGWGVATLFLLGPCWLGSIAIERVGLASTRQRFAVGALTRGVPLLLLSIALRLAFPAAAFGAMLLGIFGLIAIVLAAVYALAVRSTRDHRAGALATALVFAWVLSFWFPLTW